MELEQIGGDGKLPHQSRTLQISTAQSAGMFLLHYYFPAIDTNIFLAWGLVASYILRFVTKEKLVWYGDKKQ